MAIFYYLLKVLAEKVHMRALSIAQRVMLLQQGLNDRSGNLDIFIHKTFLDFEVKLKGLGECPINKLDQVNLSFPQPVRVYLGVLYRRHFFKILVLRSSTVCFFSVFGVWRNWNLRL